MEKIYFIAIGLFILEILLYLTGFNFTFWIIILFVTYLFFLKRKEISFYIFLIIFLIRILLFVDFSILNEGDNIYFKAEVINGYGKIEKINKKISFENYSFHIDELEDGEYNIKGEVLERRQNFLNIKVLEKQLIKENILKFYTRKKLEIMKEYISNGCFNLTKGMVLGSSRGIAKKIKEVFRYSGTSHLLAISGLHVGIVMFTFSWVFSFFKITKKIKNIGIILILTAYILSINISPSVVRAYIMGIIYLSSDIFYERLELKKSLAFSFSLSLIIYPNSLSNISFLMSYISVFSILFIYPKIKIRENKEYTFILNAFIFTFMIQTILSPLTLYYFKTIPVLSFISNVIITPLGILFIFFSFISFLVPKFLLKFFMGWFLEDIYELLLKSLFFMKKIPFLTIKINNKINLWLALTFYIFIGIIYLYKNYKNLKNK